MNKVILVGRLTSDPELKKTTTGKSVLNFTIAAVERGDTEFIYCTAWEKLAELINTYCYKGFILGLAGTLKRKEYMNKDGEKRHEMEVHVENIQFLTPKQKAESQPNFENVQLKQPDFENYKPDLTRDLKVDAAEEVRKYQAEPIQEDYDPCEDFGEMFLRV